MHSKRNADSCSFFCMANYIGSPPALPRNPVHKASIGVRNGFGIKGEVRKRSSHSSIPFAENLKGYGRIPGPFGLPIVGNLLSFASFTPQAHLVWTKWAETFGKIYKYDCSLHMKHIISH